MSKTITLRAGSSSFVRADHPARPYGNPAQVTMATSGVAASYWWVSLASIPANAIITAAEWSPHQDADWAVPGLGTRVLTAQPCAAWAAKTLTFNHQPALLSGSATSSRTVATDKGTAWPFDFKDLVQDGLARGSLYFRMTSDTAVLRNLRGFSAAYSKPTLTITYEIVTPAPVGVSPDGGAVGTRTPTFTWTPWAGESGRQLQLATDPDFSALVYDSGMVAGTVASYPLAGTGYTLPDVHVYGRVRRNGPLGLSAWSEVVELWYVAHLSLDLISPDGDVSDGTSTFLWAVTGGVQKSFRARIISGVTTVWDSRETPGDADSIAPTLGLKKLGASAVARVDVTDDELRVATPGDPIAVSASHTFTLVTSAAIGKVADLHAETDPIAPWITFGWSHDELPDEWGLFDADTGDLVSRFDGAESTEDGENFAFLLYTAHPNRARRYAVAAIPNNVIGPMSNATTVAPSIKGVWLFDPATGESVLLTGRDELEGTNGATVVTTSPLDLGHDVVREMSRRGPTVPLTGVLANVYGRRAMDDYDTLMRFKADGVARPLRLAWALVSIPVVVHTIDANPIRAGVSPDTPRWKVTATAVAQGENPWDLVD